MCNFITFILFKYVFDNTIKNKVKLKKNHKIDVLYPKYKAYA